jgi:hypothetical protein
MRITLALFLIGVSLSSLVFCQNNQTCEADIRHLRLPARAYIDEVLGLDSPPVAFLFTQGDLDVYSATDFKVMAEMQKYNMPFEPMFTIILVYQDEVARQRKIEFLLKQPHFIAPNRYTHAPFKNLKFGVWQFKLTPVWVDDVLKREWLISEVQFFEPPSCVPDEDRNSSALEQNILEASSMMNSKNWIDGVIFQDSKRMPAERHSPLEKAADMMRQKMKSYGLPN